MSTQMPDMSQLPDAPIPSQGSQSPSVVNDAVNAAQPVAQPTQAPQESQPVFKRILTGALAGLLPGGGGLIGGGIQSATQAGAEQQKVNIAQRRQAAQQALEAQASSIKFQDAQAANAVAQAARNNAQAAALPQEARDAHDKAQLEMADQLQQLGITPTVIADDSHDAAKSALEGLTQSHGAVPHLFNLEVGGQHLAYDLTQLSGTPQGLTVINAARAAQGQDPITATQWRQTPKAAQSQTAEKALQFWAPPPTTNAAQANGLYLQYKSFADAYAKKPDADPQVVTRLQGLVSNLKAQKDGQVNQEKSIKGSEAYVSAFAQKTARDAADKENYQQSLQGVDVTGWNPDPKRSMSQQQLNTATQQFSGKELQAAQEVEKGYQMFQDAYKKHLAGDDKTGAASMMATAQHLGTTFAGIKGSRQTKDIIHEHMNAIGLGDRAQRLAANLKSGQMLSENQWQEFGNLITDARKQAWILAANNAHARGIPITDDMGVPRQLYAKGR